MGIEETVTNTSVLIIGIATVILAVLAGISLLSKKLSETFKKIIFSLIILTVIIPTVYMSVTTVYLNMISSSKGPVHWHADTEIWACGKELDIKDPTGLSNKVGTATLHEHNDKRIHLEGIVLEPKDASLGKFFSVIGGNLNESSMTVPTTKGDLTYRNGQTCPDGTSGTLQVFIFKTNDEGYYSQQKITNPQDYIMAPEQTVPAGDCVIIIFGQEQARTDQLCRSYKAAVQNGKLKGEKQSGS